MVRRAPALQTVVRALDVLHRWNDPELAAGHLLRFLVGLRRGPARQTVERHHDPEAAPRVIDVLDLVNEARLESAGLDQLQKSSLWIEVRQHEARLQFLAAFQRNAGRSAVFR